MPGFLAAWEAQPRQARAARQFLNLKTPLACVNTYYRVLIPYHFRLEGAEAWLQAAGEEPMGLIKRTQLVSFILTSKTEDIHHSQQVVVAVA